MSKELDERNAVTSGTPQTASPEALDLVFRSARTFNRFLDKPVEDADMQRLYELAKWGPTSVNSQPARYVFVRSAAAKEKLKNALFPNNVEKTMAAPVTVIVAQDTRFYEFLPRLTPMPGARELFAAQPPLAQETALRNSSLQGAYLMVAARMLGLDAGPMSGFDAAKLNEAFFPDGRWHANFLINLGYGDPAGNYPRGPRLDFDEAAVIA
ncbi:putative malonic semialdehyde reductase RutE [compost metagenome]